MSALSRPAARKLKNRSSEVTSPGRAAAARALTWAILSVSVSGPACKPRAEPDSKPSQPDSASALTLGSGAPAPSAQGGAAPAPSLFDNVESTQLLTLPASAYNATLALDDEVIYLLTAGAAYRLAPGGQVQRFPLDLSYGWAVMRSSFLYWSKGAIWKASKSDGRPTRVAKLEKQPQYFVASDDEFAWVDKRDEEHHSVRSLDGKKVRTVYESNGRIDAATMLNDWVFFVERPDASGWRIGGVRVSGGEPVFSEPKKGRSPSMLSAWRDLYYYDGNSREIRRMTPDLRHEEAVIKDFICSPLAVWGYVYCGHVEGLSAISLEKRSATRVLDNVWGAITTIAARGNLIVWLNDTGPDKLALRVIELPQAP